MGMLPASRLVRLSHEGRGRQHAHGDAKQALHCSRCLHVWLICLASLVNACQHAAGSVGATNIGFCLSCVDCVAICSIVGNAAVHVLRMSHAWKMYAASGGCRAHKDTLHQCDLHATYWK